MALRVGTVTPRYFAALTLDPGTVNANSTARETYTVAGLATDMLIVVNQTTVTTGLYLIGARASAANELQLDWWNSTGVGINPASQEIKVIGY